MAREPFVNSGKEPSMGNDEAKGRVKRAAGELSGDKRLKREGTVDKAAGKAKEAVDKAAEKAKDIVDGRR
jgi:uncharacterized protein YjbJ (UPF0337 family)